MSSRRGNKADGFALIESIAVLALSALVMLTLVIATGLVTRNSAAAARRSNAAEALATGFAAFRRDVASASYARAVGGQDAPLFFEGSAKSISFAAGGDDPERGGGSLIRIEARYDNDRGALVRSSAVLTPQLSGFADARYENPVILHSGPYTYSFVYADTKSGPAKWSSAWTNPDALPGVVGLKLTDIKSGIALPPLVVPLRVNAEAACSEGEADCAPDADPAAGPSPGKGGDGGSRGEGSDDARGGL